MDAWFNGQVFSGCRQAIAKSYPKLRLMSDRLAAPWHFSKMLAKIERMDGYLIAGYMLCLYFLQQSLV